MKPDFHDGNLTGMRVTDKTLHLYLTATDKQKFIVTIPNVRRMRADNFLEGNIVFDVTVHQHSELSKEKLRCVYGYNEEEAAKYLSKNMAEIADKKLSLFELGSSYGCELLVLFAGTIQIESESEKRDAVAA